MATRATHISSSHKLVELGRRLLKERLVITREVLEKHRDQIADLAGVAGVEWAFEQLLNLPKCRILRGWSKEGYCPCDFQRFPCSNHN